jgi:hypothetical protein
MDVAGRVERLTMVGGFKLKAWSGTLHSLETFES